VKFGVIYQSFDLPAVFLEYARAVEDLDFDDLWVCDSSLHARDVIAYLALAAVNTRGFGWACRCFSRIRGIRPSTSTPWRPLMRFRAGGR